MIIWKTHLMHTVLLLVWLLSAVPGSSAGVIVDVQPEGLFDFMETGEQAIQYANAYLKRQATAESVGQELRLRGSSKDALDRLEREAQRAPTDLTLQTALGAILFREDSYKEAQRHFEEAVRTNPSYAIGHYYLAYLAILGKDWDVVAKHFEEAVQADPTFVPAYNILAIIYNKRGKTDAALRTLTRGLTHLPNEASFFYNQAILHWDHENWEAAEVSLENAVARQPTEHHRLVLSMILTKRQRYERAQNVLESILDKNPKHVMALVWLAGTYRDRHDHAKAIALIEQVIALEPENKDLRDELREHQEAARNWKNQERKE